MENEDSSGSMVGETEMEEALATMVGTMEAAAMEICVQVCGRFRIGVSEAH